MFEKLYRGEPTVRGRSAAHRNSVGRRAGTAAGDGTRGSRGYSVTALDGSAAAIERARSRADEAKVRVTFDVTDATNLAGYDGRFDTVLDSALYHCLDDDGQRSCAAGLHRSTRPGARWHLY